MKIIKAKKQAFNYIFCVFMGIVYAFAITHAAISGTILGADTPSLLLYVVVATVIIYAVFSNRYIFFAFLGILIIVGLLITIGLKLDKIPAGITEAASGQLWKVFEFFKGDYQYKNEVTTIINIAVAVFFSLISYVFVYLYFNVPLIILVGLVVTGIPIALGYGKSSIAILLLMFCIVVFLLKRMNLATIASEEDEDKSNYVFSLLAIPLGALILLPAFFLPKPYIEFVDYGGVNPVNMVENMIYDTGAWETQGFSEQGTQLGGPVTLGNRLVMEVKADERLYLRGNTMDNYTGAAWSSTKIDKRDLTSAYDFVDSETGARGARVLTAMSQDVAYLNSIENTDIFDKQNYYMDYYGYKMKLVTIFTDDNRTKEIYTPGFSYTLVVPKDIEVEVSEADRISTKNVMGQYTTYGHEYFAWEYDTDSFAILLRKREAEKTNWDDFSDYLQLPEDFPERVTDLAVSLTKDKATDYDRVTAMVDYLREFPYTLAPKEVPNNVDFVDYFLFEGKEGYCVYYATALATMARSIGIPARYVEGYVMPEEVGTNGRYQVTSKQAHAWTEVYFPNVGWVRFEPTGANITGLADERFTGVPEEVLETDIGTESEISSESLPEYKEIEETNTTDKGDPNGENDIDAEAIKETVKIPKPVIYILILFGAVILLFVGKLTNDVIKKEKYKKIEKLPNSGATVEYFAQTIKTAGKLGYPIKKQETANAYAKRIKGLLPLPRDINMEEIASIYSKAAYSNSQISDEEKEKVKNGYYEISNEKKQNKAKRFIDKFKKVK